MISFKALFISVVAALSIWHSPAQHPPDAPQPASFVVQTVIDQKELFCLSEAIFFEAGNQSYRGKLAVANVIVNRLHSGQWPDSICRIVRQRGQFTYQDIRNRLYPKTPGLLDQVNESIDVAVQVITGTTPDNTGGALYFINPRIATDRTWINKFHRTAVIGDHWFYRPVSIERSKH